QRRTRREPYLHPHLGDWQRAGVHPEAYPEPEHDHARGHRVKDLTIPQTLLHPLKAKVIGFHEEEREYSFQVEYPDPEACPNCGVCGEVVGFGKKQMKFRDLPLHGRWVTLWLVRRRF